MFALWSGTNGLWCELSILNYVLGTLSPLAGAYLMSGHKAPRLFKDPDACLVSTHSVSWKGAPWKDCHQRPQRNGAELQQDGARRQWAWGFGGSAPGTPPPSTGCSMSYQRGCHNTPVLFKLLNDAVDTIKNIIFRTYLEHLAQIANLKITSTIKRIIFHRKLADQIKLKSQGRD